MDTSYLSISYLYTVLRHVTRIDFGREGGWLSLFMGGGLFFDFLSTTVKNQRIFAILRGRSPLAHLPLLVTGLTVRYGNPRFVSVTCKKIFTITRETLHMKIDMRYGDSASR